TLGNIAFGHRLRLGHGLVGRRTGPNAAREDQSYRNSASGPFQDATIRHLLQSSPEGGAAGAARDKMEGMSYDRVYISQGSESNRIILAKCENAKFLSLLAARRRCIPLPTQPQ